MGLLPCLSPHFPSIVFLFTLFPHKVLNLYPRKIPPTPLMKERGVLQASKSPFDKGDLGGSIGDITPSPKLFDTPLTSVSRMTDSLIERDDIAEKEASDSILIGLLESGDAIAPLIEAVWI